VICFFNFYEPDLNTISCYYKFKLGSNGICIANSVSLGLLGPAKLVYMLTQNELSARQYQKAVTRCVSKLSRTLPVLQLKSQVKSCSSVCQCIHEDDKHIVFKT
jgi:hypothetical protein